jgi:hypothetical protein
MPVGNVAAVRVERAPRSMQRKRPTCVSHFGWA